MSELANHLKAATDNLNRLLATIDDPDQSKLISRLFNNMADLLRAHGERPGRRSKQGAVLSTR